MSDPQVDRLIVIGRTSRQECPDHGQPAKPGHYLRCPECDGPMVFVEYDLVPTGQHAGAVEALDEAIKAARLFNRSGMTWLEYDRLLVRLEGVVNDARGQ